MIDFATAAERWVRNVCNATAAMLSVFLCGCAANGVPGLAQPYDEPATQPVLSAQRAARLIVDDRGHLWKDPDSIRDASIGEPYACRNPTPVGDRLFNSPASCVCLELNAKNSYGGYTGIKRTIAVLPEYGEITMLDGGTKGYEQRCQQLRPFAELNGHGAAKTSRSR